MKYVVTSQGTSSKNGVKYQNGNTPVFISDLWDHLMYNMSYLTASHTAHLSQVTFSSGEDNNMGVAWWAENNNTLYKALNIKDTSAFNSARCKPPDLCFVFVDDPNL